MVASGRFPALIAIEPLQHATRIDDLAGDLQRGGSGEMECEKTGLETFIRGTRGLAPSSPQNEVTGGGRLSIYPITLSVRVTANAHGRLLIPSCTQVDSF